MLKSIYIFTENGDYILQFVHLQNFEIFYRMVIVLIRFKKHVFCQEISVRDIDTSLVVQRNLDNFFYYSVNREGQCSPAKPYGMTFNSNYLTETIFSQQSIIGYWKTLNILTNTRFIGFSACQYKKIICYISL